MTFEMANCGRVRLFSNSTDTEPCSSSIKLQSNLQKINDNFSGHECQCCPYGYHIDLDFVRYCESWQSVASNRIQQSNKKRHQRARQKKYQSIDFLFGFGPLSVQEKLVLSEEDPIPSKSSEKPSNDFFNIQKDLHETLRNFEKTLSQNFSSNNPSTENCNSSSDKESENNGNYTSTIQKKLAIDIKGSDYLQSLKTQMPLAHGRLEQLEKQVKEIPLLYVQISVLKEERRILLKQLTSLKKLDAVTTNNNRTKKDVGISCGVVTRDIGICHQLKTQETWTNSEPILTHHCSRSTETLLESKVAKLEKGTQCFGMAFEKKMTYLLKSLKSKDNLSREPSRSTKYTTNHVGVQCTLNYKKESTNYQASQLEFESKMGNLMQKKNKETQVAESWPRSKLKLSTGITAKPNVSDVSTETTDHSISLLSLRRATSKNNNFLINISKAEPVNYANTKVLYEKPVLVKKCCDFDTFAGYMDTAVSKFTTKGSNYCDECKHNRESFNKNHKTHQENEKKTCKPNFFTKKLKSTESNGSKKIEEIKTKIPVILKSGAKKKCNLIRQDTWIEGLDKLNTSKTISFRNKSDCSLSFTTPATTSIKNITLMRNQFLTNECSQMKNSKLIDEDQAPIQTEEKQKKIIDTTNQDSFISRMVSEGPKISISHVDHQLPKEITAALKILDDHIRDGSVDCKVSLLVNNARNIVRHEWFKISSTVQADPLKVKLFTDQMESLSSSLLHHVINLVDSNGNTALHYAVSHSNSDVVLILINSKFCNVNKLNNAGYTPVMLATLTSMNSSIHLSVLKKLFEAADVNLRAKMHGQTALMLAALHGCRDISRLLIDAGAAINLQDEDGSTALMCAAEHGHAEILCDLLSRPECDFNITDVDGSSALRIALEAGHADIGVILYAHQRTHRVNFSGNFSSLLPVPKLERQIATSANYYTKSTHYPRYSTLSLSAPASPVNSTPRNLRSCTLSLVDA